MKASELRIGNYLKHNDRVIVVGSLVDAPNWHIVEYNSDKAILTTAKIEDIEPIPLTKEILLKCGFDTIDYKKVYIGIDVNHSNFTLTYPYILGEWQKSFAYQYETFELPRFRELRYLHELQNLFFALTGQELDCSLLEPKQRK